MLKDVHREGAVLVLLHAAAACAIWVGWLLLKAACTLTASMCGQ